MQLRVLSPIRIRLQFAISKQGAYHRKRLGEEIVIYEEAGNKLKQKQKDPTRESKFDEVAELIYRTLIHF
jgi:hypothetical protein